jgi:peptide deformylase
VAIRRILSDNHPVLRGEARPVKEINSAILRLLEDMVETMYEAKGVGLAAPQVGVARRIIVIDSGDKQLVQLINPRILQETGTSTDIEGCLSIPGVYGEVDRAERVTVTGRDPADREILLEADGLLARILQHEIDHLNGTLFIDRATRLLDAEELKREQEQTG